MNRLTKELNDDADYYIKLLESTNVDERRLGASGMLFMSRPSKKFGDDIEPLSTKPKIDVMSTRIVPALMKAIRDPDSKVRQAVVSTLGNIDDYSKPAIPLLTEALKDRDVKVRRSAASAILNLGILCKDILPDIKKNMDDSDRIVNIYLAAATAILGEDVEKVTRYLMKFATDETDDAGTEASRVFVRVGEKAIPFLSVGLDNMDHRVRGWTIVALSHVIRSPGGRANFPSQTIQLLINELNDKDPKNAFRAVDALSSLGERAKDAVPEIVKRFKDPDWQVRADAIRHISGFGQAARSAIPALTDALKDETERVRIEAKRALDSLNKTEK